MKYDVVIVGCGPAGASLGYLLLKNNIKVAIIDKKKFPREKLCGGLFTYKSKLLYEEIFEKEFTSYINKTNNVNFFKKDNLILNLKTKIPFYLVSRKEFDFDMYKEYINKGGICFTESTISKIDTENNFIYLSSGKKIMYSILIGADGANSQVRKLIDKEYKPNGFCLEVEEFPIKNSNNINIHFDCFYKGYGWCFNKGSFSTVGLGGEYNKQKILESTELSNVIFKYYNVNSKDVKGAFVPFGKFVKNPCKGNILLIGDAAGFTDPITGEGLYFCFKSAIYACNAIKDYFSYNNKFTLEELYLPKVREIQEKIKEANKLKKFIFNKVFKNLTFAFLKNNLEFTKYVCDDIISTYTRNYKQIISSYLLSRLK